MVKKLELPIDLLPLIADSINAEAFEDPNINAEFAKEDNFVSIKERESFMTRVKGTMGKQILFYKEDLPNEKTVKKFRKQGRLVEE